MTMPNLRMTKTRKRRKSRTSEEVERQDGQVVLSWAVTSDHALTTLSTAELGRGLGLVQKTFTCFGLEDSCFGLSSAKQTLSLHHRVCWRVRKIEKEIWQGWRGSRPVKLDRGV